MAKKNPLSKCQQPFMGGIANSTVTREYVDEQIAAAIDTLRYEMIDYVDEQLGAVPDAAMLRNDVVAGLRDMLNQIDYVDE